MNKDLQNILQTCLEELKHGAELDALLARYPRMAGELRPALQSALRAQALSAPQPAREAVMRGRARLMQKVAEVKEQKAAPRKRVIPFFQRLALSFSVTLFFLTGGTGLVSASSNALPGQNLYPVKRNWESVRLFFAFSQNARLLLQDEFKQEREHEAGELLFEREESDVELYGALSIVNGQTFISSLPVVFPPDAQLPPVGTSLEVKGRTTTDGYVEVFKFELEQPKNDSGENSKDAPEKRDPEPKDDENKESHENDD